LANVSSTTNLSRVDIGGLAGKSKPRAFPAKVETGFAAGNALKIGVGAISCPSDDVI